jgi:hypothetical protein
VDALRFQATTTTTTIPTTTTGPPVPDNEERVGGTGFFRVGSRMAPGVWKSTGSATDGCYWARLDENQEIIDQPLRRCRWVGEATFVGLRVRDAGLRRLGVRGLAGFDPPPNAGPPWSATAFRLSRPCFARVSSRRNPAGGRETSGITGKEGES